MKVYVYDPFIENDIIIKNKCTPIDKVDGFKIADFISVHLPLNSKTKNLISKNEFKIFKKNLILVNTARGGIVNELELFEALKNKQIYGAGLDVFEDEPPLNDNPLLSLNNIILTPHNAALTIECRKRMSLESCENAAYYLLKSDKLNRNNIINLNNIDLL